MSKKRHMLAVFLLCVFLINIMLSLTNIVKAQETSANPEQVLVFLEDVVQIDLAKYKITLVQSSVNPWGWDGNLTHTQGDYQLDATAYGGTSIIRVFFRFIDKELTSVSFSIPQTPPIFIGNPKDQVQDAVGFLERYQTFTNDSEVSTMKNILETVNPKTNTTTIVGNIKLEVEYESDETDFCWSKNFNGADFSRLRLSYEDGLFDGFYDDRSYIKIGSTEVNISEEQAISFALDQAKAYSFFCENRSVIEIGFREEYIRAKLNVKPHYGQDELYPFWTVDVPLDRVYGGAMIIKVVFWADNGEIDERYPLGYGIGLIDPEDILSGRVILTSSPSPYPHLTPTPSPTPTSSPEPNQFPTTLAVASIATIGIIGIGSLIFFKKYRK